MLINGGGGQIEIREGADNMMSGTIITKKNHITNNGEETKTNFFDPKSFYGRRGE